MDVVLQSRAENKMKTGSTATLSNSLEGQAASLPQETTSLARKYIPHLNNKETKFPTK